MVSEGSSKYTPEELDAILAAYDNDPRLGNYPNEGSKGDWMMLRDALFSRLEGQSVEQDSQSGVVFLPEAATGKYPPRES